MPSSLENLMVALTELGIETDSYLRELRNLLHLHDHIRDTLSLHDGDRVILLDPPDDLSKVEEEYRPYLSTYTIGIVSGIEWYASHKAWFGSFSPVDMEDPHLFAMNLDRLAFDAS